MSPFRMNKIRLPFASIYQHESHDAGVTVSWKRGQKEQNCGFEGEEADVIYVYDLRLVFVVVFFLFYQTYWSRCEIFIFHLRLESAPEISHIYTGKKNASERWYLRWQSCFVEWPLSKLSSPSFKDIYSRFRILFFHDLKVYFCWDGGYTYVRGIYT